MYLGHVVWAFVWGHFDCSIPHVDGDKIHRNIPKIGNRLRSNWRLVRSGLKMTRSWLFATSPAYNVARLQSKCPICHQMEHIVYISICTKSQSYMWLNGHSILRHVSCLNKDTISLRVSISGGLPRACKIMAMTPWRTQGLETRATGGQNSLVSHWEISRRVPLDSKFTCRW